MTEKIEFITLILLCLSIAFYAILIIHDFFGYIDAYPYLAVDDSLANVSYSLAHEFRYGFLTSPLQAPGNLYRHDGFFNYGPWYFFLSAGLIWLFGYSIELLRSIHLFGILLIVIIAYFWFRGKGGTIAASFFTMLILHCFDNAQWPMVRPDIMVSFFTVLFIVSSGLAIKDRKPVYWFLAGIFAACAALSHLIAWSLILSGIIVFFIAQVHYRREAASITEWKGKAIKELLLLLFGFVFSAFMFFGSFGFRFKEFFSFLSAYNQQINTIQRSYSEILFTHINMAFNYQIHNKTALSLVIIFSIIGMGILILSLFFWQKERKKIIIYLLPPMIVGSLYLLSLGTYNNFACGYVILLQVISFWFIGAAIYMLFILISSRFTKLDTILSISIPVILFIFILQPIKTKLTTHSYRDQNAMNWVSITDYTNKIIEPLPVRSTAWGTIMFGIESPERIQLVQFGEGVNLVMRLPIADKKALAPDYIIWGYVENRDSSLSVFKSNNNIFQLLSNLFPEYRFELVSMVLGDPYGVTRIFQRKLISEPFSDNLPNVSIYNSSNHQWSNGIGTLKKISLKISTPVKFNVGYTQDSLASTANNTISFLLEQGDYLLKVAMNKGGNILKHNKMLCVTSVPEVKKVFSELGLYSDDRTLSDCTPYVYSDKDTYLIHRHLGGEVYVSQFDSSPDSRILKVDVYPIQYLKNYRQDIKELTNSLPDFSQWQPDKTSGVKVKSIEESCLLIIGNDSQFGYQISSPPIAIHPNREVTLRLPVTVLQGKVGVGVLDQSGGKWIVPPTKTDREIVFKSLKNSSFTVVIANSYENAKGNVYSRFIVSPGSYFDRKDELYTDMLVNAVKSHTDMKNQDNR
jgi:hypothetical protein